MSIFYETMVAMNHVIYFSLKIHVSSAVVENIGKKMEAMLHSDPRTRMASFHSTPKKHKYLKLEVLSNAFTMSISQWASIFFRIVPYQIGHHYHVE